ncbi:hypothetical protein Q5P01_000562 [Channa striata]|uniref:Uncharacterized protein n=1 Tax=Channa striata TaxID=64152 RepID=A0AA88IIB1_CHASR|nr:hypothetical protein Q5P01_000562 [Channa striata]
MECEIPGEAGTTLLCFCYPGALSEAERAPTPASPPTGSRRTCKGRMKSRRRRLLIASDGEADETCHPREPACRPGVLVLAAQAGAPSACRHRLGIESKTWLTHNAFVTMIEQWSPGAEQAIASEHGSAAAETKKVRAGDPPGARATLTLLADRYYVRNIVSLNFKDQRF